MSVFVELRIKGDPANFEKYAQANADLMRNVAQAGKDAGAIRHSFAGGKDEVVVIDEWPSEAAFQKFFTSQPDIPKLMQEGGATGAPQITFYRKLDTPDAF